jgi:2-polyprenyl-6-methoxyphenol hydroxylase-like FAD-dependent oxidoreductase
VLAGDAAHAVHPLAGQGLNLGLADAQELARVLHEREYWRSLGDEKLLRRYERARKADVLALSWTTDGLQQLFAQPVEPWGWIRNWGMRGFDRSGPLKHWVARRAMGQAPAFLRTGRT